MKATSFVYTDLEVVNSASPFGGWSCKEFALAAMNPNRAPLWTQASLISNDPFFTYKDGSVRVFTFPPRFYRPFSLDERFVGSNENMLEVAFDETKQINWHGSVEIESIAGRVPWDQAQSVAPAPFYSFSPNTFQTSFGAGPSQPAAYNAAWQNGGPWNVPVEWDGDLGLGVCPYANYWFGDKVWPRGWSTVATIRNGSGQRCHYTIRNHLYGMHHGTQADPCAIANEGVTEVSVWLEDGKECELNPFAVPLNVASRHDTVLTFECQPTIPGSGFYVKVVSNLAGKVICP